MSVHIHQESTLEVLLISKYLTKVSLRLLTIFFYRLLEFRSQQSNNNDVNDDLKFQGKNCYTRNFRNDEKVKKK